MRRRLGLDLAGGEPLLQLKGFQIEPDRLGSKPNVRNFRKMPVYPSGLYAHHPCELGNSQVLVLHKSASVRAL
jgi:hypothetical protein